MPLSTDEEDDGSARLPIESLLDLNEQQLRARLAVLSTEELTSLQADVHERSNELFSQFKITGAMEMLHAEMEEHPAPYFAIPPPSAESLVVDKLLIIIDEEAQARSERKSDGGVS